MKLKIEISTRIKQNRHWSRKTRHELFINVWKFAQHYEKFSVDDDGRCSRFQLKTLHQKPHVDLDPNFENIFKTLAVFVR